MILRMLGSDIENPDRSVLFLGNRHEEENHPVGPQIRVALGNLDGPFLERGLSDRRALETE